MVRILLIRLERKGIADSCGLIGRSACKLDTENENTMILRLVM